MSELLIYVSTWKIKEGRLEDFKQFSRQIVEYYRQNEPQLIAFNIFLNEDETEMTSIQIHPNANSMDFHMRKVEQALEEEMNEWVERVDFIEPKHVEIYGTPSDALLMADQPFVDAGFPRSIKPFLLTGFVRSTA